MQRRDVATVPSELVAVAPGSQPLRNPKHERFARLRATLRPKVEAAGHASRLLRTIPPKRPPNESLRTREHLTEAEVERCLAEQEGRRS